MKELGPGFLERVYKNALLIAMRQKGLSVEIARAYEEWLDEEETVEEPSMVSNSRWGKKITG